MNTTDEGGTEKVSAPAAISMEVEESSVKSNHLEGDFDTLGSITEGDEENQVPSQNTTSLKTLTEGHSTLQVKLKQVLLDQKNKEKNQKDLTENLSRQKERTRLIQERLHCLTEKLFVLKTSVKQREKKQESVYEEITDTKWKYESSNQSVTKIQHRKESLKSLIVDRNEQFSKAEDPEGLDANLKATIKDDIQRFENNRNWIQENGVEVRSILNGNKMIELEQRKAALRDGMNELDKKCTSLTADINERTKQIETKTNALGGLKEHYRSKQAQVRNQLNYLRETECRLQRSNDYLRQKIDYGMHVPAPPPWPATFHRKTFNQL